MTEEHVVSPAADDLAETVPQSGRVATPDVMIDSGRQSDRSARHAVGADAESTGDRREPDVTTDAAVARNATVTGDADVVGSASVAGDAGAGRGADPTALLPAERPEQRTEEIGTAGDPPATHPLAGERSGDDGVADRRAARRGYAKTVAGVLLAYAALRGLGMAFMLAWAHHLGIIQIHIFYRFDMSGYLRIAQFGYDKALTYGPNGVPHTTNLAFFPLYPGMIRAVVDISPLPYVWAGLVVAWLSSLAAAWGLFAVGSHLYNRRVGVLLVVLWAVVPYAIDQSLGLTESLFTALAAWCFYALMKRRWLTAGVLCMISGLSRPTAVALMAAVGLAALIALIRREKPWWRPVVATAISPLGWLAYLVWVARRLHRADGWFYVQDKAWGSSFDGGRYSAHMALDTLRGHQKTIEPYVVTFILAVIVVLFVLSILERQPLPMIIYSAVLFITTVGGTNFYHTDPRHLLPAFPLLLPVAVGIARMRVRNVAAVLIVMTAFSVWYGGWLVLIWGYSY